MDWGGHIHLVGTGTERQPYDCESTDDHPSGIVVQKGLKMASLNSTPYVSCVNGFHFHKRPVSKPLNIVLSGIVFGQTPLTFQDCDNLTVFNCSFEDAFVAISVYVRLNTRMYVNIIGSVFFRNNTSCLEIFPTLNDQTLVVNIKKALFSDNGLHKQQFPGGLVTIKSDATQQPSLYVQISCFHITAVNNYGHFINLDLPKATTDEIYNDVILSNNTSYELPINGQTDHNSLYNSIAKETRATFSKMRCSFNRLLRCIRIQSEEAKIEVRNSSFIELRLPNQNGGAMLLSSTVNGSLVLFNCSFHRNVAKGGGALFAHSQNGALSLNITNVNFTKCAAASHGCAILVGDQTSGMNRMGTYRLRAIFKGVRVRYCHGFYGTCDSIRLTLFNGKVVINDSSWSNNIQSVAGALTVLNTGGNADITISGCAFVRNNASKSVVSVLARRSRPAGNLLITNSVMSGDKYLSLQALYVQSNVHIKLMDVLFTSYPYAVRIDGSHEASLSNASSDRYPFSVSIYNCTFRDNTIDVVATSPDPSRVELTITNTIFITRKAFPDSHGLHFFILPFKTIAFIDAIIELDNVTFVSKPCNLLAFLFHGKKTIRIKRSLFLNCLCLHRYVWSDISRDYSFYDFSTGGISVASSSDKWLSRGCVEEKQDNDTHPLWKYQTHVTFEDTLFEGNGGLIAGGVYLCNGHTTFKRCRFRNNFAAEHSGHVYSADGTGQVDFKDCIFNSTEMNVTLNGTTYHKSTFVQSDSGGPINLENTTLSSFAAERDLYPLFDISSGGYVHMDNNSTIECPIGSKLLLENDTHFVHTEHNHSSCRINVTVLKYSCQQCSPGFYSILRGVSRGLTLNSTLECLECPFGASCIDRNIVAKANFWGHPNNSSDPPSLTFIACPEHYCQQPKSETNGYNSCQGNRSGILCGECVSGYSATLFSPECRKNEECDNYWFWILTFLLTIGLSLYLLNKPSTFSLLANQILWFRRKENHREMNELHRVDQHSDSAYIKITFYFYQAAELLIVGSIESHLRQIPFISTIIAAFNFQLRTINNGLGCPFAGLTSVTKELVLAGTVFLTMADIVLIYCVHCVINMLWRKEKPSLFHYMAVIMEVLLLGYERLAETCLELMNCVSIGSEKRLFIDANVPCMQWWQYLLLAYIVVFVVPFIVVLYCGSSKLYTASINPTEFLAACVLPLPFLIYWSCMKTEKRQGETSGSAQVVNKDILEVLHGPFRAPNNVDKGTLYWESVLIGRRFILLTCHSFITSSMLRMASMAAACSLIALHHVVKNPFRDPMANRAETLSLAVLLMIAMINLTKATLMSFGITIDGPYTSYLDTLEWFEVGALAVVPALVTVLVIFAILSQLARFVFFLIEQAVHCCQRPGSAHWPWDEQRKPLLDIVA